jgi:hypothetical protein
MTAHFELQPAKSELSTLAEQHHREAGDREQRLERTAFDAGLAIRNGDYSLINLEPIVRWKSEHAVHYLIGNSSERIRRALEVAAAPEASTHEAVNALLALHGIDVPIASAILTAIFPERYTVMDCLILEALGYPRQDVQFYEDFLAFCRRLVNTGVVPRQSDMPEETPLRNLDSALRQWSENHSDVGVEVTAGTA